MKFKQGKLVIHKKTLVFSLLVFLLLSVIVLADIGTRTEILINILSVAEFTNTLLGQSAVTSTDPPAATTSIEFNTSNGERQDVNATVVGGSTQDASNPIMSFDNTGTVNINLTINITQNLGCMALRGSNNFTLGVNNNITTTPFVINNSFAPSDVPGPGKGYWFMQMDFNNCTTANSRRVNATAIAIQS